MVVKDRILVIDDEESIRFTFENFLSEEGYLVVTARDYDEAIAKLNEAEFDLIFADILLGGKTGIDVMREVRERNLPCPVVIITGDPNVDSAAEAVRLGAFDYIPKPVRFETLVRITHLALRHKKMRDEREKYRSNLEAIFRSVKDAIITVDKELNVVEVNEAAKSICGFSRGDIGKPFAAMLRKCKGRCSEAVVDTIKKRRPFEMSRLECRHDNHRDQVITLTTSPLLDGQGKFSGAVLVIRDETRLANLERDLREREQFHNIIGKCEKIQKIYSLIEDLADVQTTVLITGESGTGKELVAEALHYKGERSHKPLVKVNCSALSENLLESELFGHVRGAFTGALRDKVGRFQRADGGTIFLDEIGDISPRMQIRLLRVLQEREFERVGDSTPIKVNVRVIAATNQNLAEKVKQGDFREDLYYRLKVVEVDLPPLRERMEDIPLLVNHFLKKLNPKFKKDIEAVSEDVQKIFMNYSWPGNIRELEHILEHAFILCRSNTITVEQLPNEFKNFAAESDREAAFTNGAEGDAEAIRRALQKTAWNKAKAARLLGMSRRTIYRKIDEFKIAESKSE